MKYRVVRQYIVPRARYEYVVQGLTPGPVSEYTQGGWDWWVDVGVTPVNMSKDQAHEIAAVMSKGVVAEIVATYEDGMPC